jgi:dTDP-4-amino-4,6-dideoxygalactose transaminase
MDAIMSLAGEHGLYVIEDCAQAHGARHRGRSVGGIGDAGAWSFCQDKIMTTAGEGGMLTLSDEESWRQAWAYKDHGKSYAAVYEQNHFPGFKWLHESFGTNWRMTEIQAAVGRIQLQRMGQWSEARKRNAETILCAARDCRALRVPDVPPHVDHAWYRCTVFIVPEAVTTGWSRDRIMQAIIDRGVPCYSGSCSEVYLEKAFDGTGWRPVTRLPVARQLGETALVFLVHPTLGKEEIERTCETLLDVMREASA